MFPSRKLIALGLGCELVFVNGARSGAALFIYLFDYRSPMVPTVFVEKISLSLIKFLCNFVVKNLIIYM